MKKEISKFMPSFCLRPSFVIKRPILLVIKGPMLLVIKGLMLFSLTFGFSMAQAAKTDMREFVMACTYGVLAGTLVGAATLAFTDKPGDNLNKVARGASLGLYAGILLGAYVVYVVPGQIQERQREQIEKQMIPVPQEDEYDGASSLPKLPRFVFHPMLGEKGIEGWGAQVRVLSF